LLKTSGDPKKPPVRPLLLLLSLCLLLLPLAADAQGTGACNVLGAGIHCSEYNALDEGYAYMDGWITVKCDAPATVTIAIGPGASGNTVNRTMTMPGANPLRYNLYTDPARKRLWGDGTTGAMVTVEVSANEEVYVSFYGRIDPDQPTSIGGYSDSPAITLTW